MGTWSRELFGNDIACDVRDEYRELLEDGVADDEATRQTIEKFARWFDDPEESLVCWLALAVTQSKVGRLDDEVRDRVLAMLDTRVEAEWHGVREQLAGPQPKRKKLRPPKPHDNDLVEGDVLVLRGSKNEIAYGVIGVRSSRVGDTVTLVRVGDFERDATMPYYLHEAFDINIDPIHWSTVGFERAGRLDTPPSAVTHNGWGTYWTPLTERLRALID